MIKVIPVKLKDNGYQIAIGSNILNQLAPALSNLKLGKDAVIITHAKLTKLYGNALAAHLRKHGYSTKFFNIPEGEQSKSATCAMHLLEQIAAYDVQKNIFIVALGGGVIGDLAGFVASIYKRGVPYIQVPTTLLAQIDSSIGGKTGIDLKYGKNLVGAIYQPKLVVADTVVLKTLSRRQIQNGLAEAIKYGVIKDAGLFELIEKNHANFITGDKDSINVIIARCAQIKATVVEADEKDIKGIRAILNFGHTVGHAIEAASDLKYQHGEAVALGMRVAANISVQLKMLSPAAETRLNQLLSAVGLPKTIAHGTPKDILSLMMHDKKFVGSRKRFVLASRIGHVTLVSDVENDVIKAAINKFMA